MLHSIYFSWLIILPLMFHTQCAMVNEQNYVKTFAFQHMNCAGYVNQCVAIAHLLSD